MDLSSTVSMTEQVSLQCADEASLQTVELPTRLGPLDQRYLLGIPLAVVFVYRSTNSAVEELIPIDRLRRALERLLDFYPHLTGRILVDPVDSAAYRTARSRRQAGLRTMQRTAYVVRDCKR